MLRLANRAVQFFTPGVPMVYYVVSIPVPAHNTKLLPAVPPRLPCHLICTHDCKQLLRFNLYRRLAGQSDVYSYVRMLAVCRACLLGATTMSC